MKLYKNLYLLQKNNLDKIIENIKKNTPIEDLYFIYVSKNVNHILDIEPMKNILKKVKKYEKCVVVGMAYGEEEAFETVRTIFEDYIKNKKNIDDMKINFLDDKW